MEPVLGDDWDVGRLQPVTEQAAIRLSQPQGVGVDWPLSINHRLEQLLWRTNDAGENTTRKELLAAIVLAVTEDPDELSKMLRTYRRSTARAALINPPAEGNVIMLPRYKSGPRSHGSQTSS